MPVYLNLIMPLPIHFDFHTNTRAMQVRGLPCAHNFHVECIDEWLRLNVKCPRCRCSVFPNLDLSALSNIRADSDHSPVATVTAAPYVRTQPPSQSYLLRLQGLLRSVRTENAGPASNIDLALEATENEVLPVVIQPSRSLEPGRILAAERSSPQH